VKAKDEEAAEKKKEKAMAAAKKAKKKKEFNWKVDLGDDIDKPRKRKKVWV
jgi:hypothetical protein